VYTTSKKPIENDSSTIDLAMLIDPALLRVARDVYQLYFEPDSERLPRPLGVAVDRVKYKGHVIFSSRPILLPQEYFIPVTEIESGYY
jgi:hypothetical protein